ncbi:hypothetical protein [Actinacidiphila soli]|uniref:hypothetical protein n=1 Tax=Actinacidiphila soli TaxID=2487275 RepID=UPI0019D015D2|nr:hypothetical protein [Actinacidiphila soli]
MPEERELADDLARVRWSPHSFRAGLRELPPAVHQGRLIGVLDLAVPALEDTSADGPLLSLHVLIDALAAEI